MAGSCPEAVSEGYLQGVDWGATLRFRLEVLIASLHGQTSSSVALIGVRLEVGDFMSKLLDKPGAFRIFRQRLLTRL